MYSLTHSVTNPSTEYEHRDAQARTNQKSGFTSDARLSQSLLQDAAHIDKTTVTREPSIMSMRSQASEESNFSPQDTLQLPRNYARDMNLHRGAMLAEPMSNTRIPRSTLSGGTSERASTFKTQMGRKTFSVKSRDGSIAYSVQPLSGVEELADALYRASKGIDNLGNSIEFLYRSCSTGTPLLPRNCDQTP